MSLPTEMVSTPIRRRAPQLWVLFECEQCHVTSRANVYLGVVMCNVCAGKPFMRAIALDS